MENKELIVSVHNLNKSYKTYQNNKELLKELVLRKKYYSEKPVLQDVSFNVYKGDVVGIIGANGAGKSTLLKILSGTLDYSSGTVEINGKISAILELGTGFHPEYSGRENIIMGGMCLGMSKSEMERKTESIIEFSELRDVIDQPFKTYSSGMQARLTFSTAVSVEPDVFIVDEALAAGDAFFVSKCLRKMKEICESGATVFFVSHSIDMIKRLCNKALYLEKGKVIEFGGAEKVCTHYELDTIRRGSELSKIQKTKDGYKASNSLIEINDIRLFDANDVEKYSFYQYDDIFVHVNLNTTKEYVSPAVFIKFMRNDGILVTSWLSSEPEFIDIGRILGEQLLVFKIPKIKLGDGVFYVSLSLYEYRSGANSSFYNDPLCTWENVVSMSIMRRGRPLSTFYDQEIEVIQVIGSKQ